MNIKRIQLIIAVLVAANGIWAGPKDTISLNYGWEFSYDSLFTHSHQVDIPHDFQIEQPWVAPSADERADQSDAAANIKSRLSARGFKEMGTGWYRKELRWKKDEGREKRVLLDFEGIMLVGDVFLNGKRIGGTDYGYVGFQIDITNQLREGDNVLMVKASTMNEKNSRWYTGGGLYRNVNLIKTSADLYFERHPLYITTHDNRFVNVSTELTNRTKSRTVRIGLKIYDPQGQLVYQGENSCKRISPARTMEAKLSEVEIPNPQLWDTEHPNLYTAVVTLIREDGSVADEVSEQFGIRTIEIGPEFGFKLNGKKVLLKGYANHHTLGALGAASYPRAIEKRIQLMKQFGLNHIRTSHNPYSRDFIRLCDKYGILVPQPQRLGAVVIGKGQAVFRRPLPHYLQKMLAVLAEDEAHVAGKAGAARLHLTHGGRVGSAGAGVLACHAHVRAVAVVPVQFGGSGDEVPGRGGAEIQGIQKAQQLA